MTFVTPDAAIMSETISDVPVTVVRMDRVALYPYQICVRHIINHKDEAADQWQCSAQFL